MKKKWLGLLSLGIIGCAIGGGVYYYQQLTYLPEWYEEEEEEIFAADTPTPNPKINQIKQELQQLLEEHDRALASSPTEEFQPDFEAEPNPLQPLDAASTSEETWQRDFSEGLDNQTLLNPAPSGSTTSAAANSPANRSFDPSVSPQLPKRDLNVTLNQNQIRELVGEDRELSEKNRALLESTQGVRANINPDQLELGAVVSVADVPLHLLSPQKRSLAEKVLQSNPALRNRSVYVALEGNYEVENGKIKINGNTQVSVGNMRFSLREVSQRSGVSQTQIERLINEQINSQLRYLQR